MPIIVITILLIIIFLSIILILFYNIFKKWSYKKMMNDCEKLFESFINPTEINEYKLYKPQSKEAFDYVFYTPKYNFYIQIVPNFGSHEICINNSIKWQIRKSFNDTSMNFVPNIDKLMRLDIDDPKAKKIYIIYPNATSLLKYINECEMIFVRPETDVYGTNVIPYLALKEKPELIKKIIENEI